MKMYMLRKQMVFQGWVKCIEGILKFCVTSHEIRPMITRILCGFPLQALNVLRDMRMESESREDRSYI